MTSLLKHHPMCGTKILEFSPLKTLSKRTDHVMQTVGVVQTRSIQFILHQKKKKNNDKNKVTEMIDMQESVHTRSQTLRRK